MRSKFNREREKRIVEILLCPTCGAIRVFVRSGLVCPNQCGRIVAVADDLLRTLRQRRPVPYATAIRGSRRPRLFAIDGYSGRFRFAPRRPTIRIVEARTRGRIRRFVSTKNTKDTK